MMLLITAYIVYKSKERWGSHWQVYGPLYLTAIGALFIMADPTRHILQDTGVWPAGPGKWSSSMYHWSGCAHGSNITCLTLVGALFEVFTYLGFATLLTGTMWNANICEKCRELQEKWHELRQPPSEEAV